MENTALEDREEYTEENEELSPEQVSMILDSIGKDIIKLRKEAVDGRKQSGIEKIWQEDEEFYQGIDEYNREGDGNWETKPAGQAETNQKMTGSTVFLNITGPYCDIASARMGDMLLPTDDRAFSIMPTPMADLVSMSKGDIPKDLMNEAASTQGAEASEDKVAKDISEQAEAMIQETKEAAEKAQKKIDDWLVECQYHAEVRSVIEDIGKCGSGVLKGPVPETKRSVAFKDGQLLVDQNINPVSRRVDYWNIFPDPACGSCIHDGSYIWEKDSITSKGLRKLKGTGHYFDYQIDRILQQGPMDMSGAIDFEGGYDRAGLAECKNKSAYTIWYFHGTVMRDDIEALGLDFDIDGDAMDVKVTMVNNVVIQLTQNILDTGDFPYDIMVWKKRKGSPFGVGVARLVRTAQRIINAATRSLMDNAGVSSAPMWLANQGLIRPANGVWEIKPFKGWLWDEDADQGIDDVRKAFTFFNVDMRQQDLQAIISLGLNMAEQVTGIPLILQGHTGSAPSTVGGMQMLQNNASTTLRRIAHLFDDLITEPHMRRYYAYLLQYGPDDSKGDFQVDARGSSALIERDIQNQAIAGVANFAMNPAFDIDPKKWSQEYLKSQRLDPKNFKYDDEEWKNVVAQMSQPQADSRLEVESMRQQSMQAKDQLDTQREERMLKFKAVEAERERETKLFLKQLELENKRLIEQGKQQLTFEQMQTRYQEHSEKMEAKITETLLKLDVQAELSGIESKPSTLQVANPPTEPAGRAPNGMAYQR